MLAKPQAAGRLRQVRKCGEFHGRPLEVSRETLDVAVRNYFAGL